MDNSTSSKFETMKPFLFKVGLTLTLSLAAFVYAKIASKRGNINVIYSSETNSQLFGCDDDLDEGFQSPSSSTCLASMADLEEELLGLKQQIESLRNREREIVTRFNEYVDLKEKESLVSRTRDAVLLEIDRYDLLDKEDENRRIEKFVIEYLRVLEKLENWKSETGLLRRQVKRLLRRKRVQSHLVREKNSKIVAKEADILRTREALGTSNKAVEILENEIIELRIELDQLQGEKKELLNMIDKSEGMRIEEQTRSANEVTTLKIDREIEVNELIYLRWNNACLKHKLTRIEEQNNNNQKEEELVEYLGVDENGVDDHQACSKRKRFLKKLKKWVEGKEEGKEKEKNVCNELVRESNEVKCFGRHSI